MQSREAKKSERGELIEDVFGPTGQGSGFEAGDGKPREPRRWKMSELSRTIVETAVDAMRLEEERFEQATAKRQARVMVAMKNDGLPDLGDDFLGANRSGDEWVEVTPETLARQQLRQT